MNNCYLFIFICFILITYLNITLLRSHSPSVLVPPAYIEIMCFSIANLSIKYGSPPIVANCDFFLVITEFNFLQMHVCPSRVRMVALVQVATQQILNAVVLQITLVILVKQVTVNITDLRISKSSGLATLRPLHTSRLSADKKCSLVG